MGDRGNVALSYTPDGPPEIWLYTHWDGSRLPALVAEALDSPQARGRYGDVAYLARILFDQLTREARDRATGWGLDIGEGDSDGTTVYVNLVLETVSVNDQRHALTFDAFIAQQGRVTV